MIANQTNTKTGLTSLRSTLAVTTALAGVLFGYGNRTAQAGACTGGGGVYNCSGATNAGADTTQYIGGYSKAVSVTTSSGFGIDASGNSSYGAINVYDGNFGATFTDNNASNITGAGFGIRVNNNGGPGSTGNVTITSNGTVTGVGYGSAYNASGIVANNSYGNVTITANNASGQSNGVFAGSSGTGSIDITANCTLCRR